MSAFRLPSLEGELARLGLAALGEGRSTGVDIREWIESNLWLRDKERQVIPFELNWAQQFYYQRQTPWDIILKPRQLGFTTLISGLFFADTLLRRNTTSVLVAHDFDSAELIFRIVRLFWERLPAAEKAQVGRPKYDRKGELYWPRIGSTYYVGTAGSTRFGHGLTINNLHCSEVSRWTHPEDSLTGLLEAVPAGGRIVLESTANGAGNHFHRLWTEAGDGLSRFTQQFFVWFEDPSYAIPGPALRDLTDEERAFKGEYGLSDNQIRWRRQKKADLRDRFDEQYPEDDVTCFLASGRCCFDRQALTAAQRRIAAEEAVEVMPVIGASTKQVSVAPAQLLVWQQPVKGRLYVIGADVGEGLAGGDASCAIVLDREKGEQVAELHGRVPPDRFGHLLDALGRWYNQAQVAVERNNHGHSTLNTMRNTCHYPRLYFHVRYDQVGKALPTLGWPTDQATKPILVDDLAAAIAGNHLIMHSSALVDECFSFVQTDRNTQEAQEGAFDDRVMAAGIAWQVRKRPVSRGTTQRPKGW